MSVKKLNEATGLEWRRVQDGTDNAGKPMYDYDADYLRVHFFITKSTDAGFGISVFDHLKQEYLTRYGLEWWHSLGRCTNRAAEIMKKIRETEK